MQLETKFDKNELKILCAIKKLFTERTVVYQKFVLELIIVDLKNRLEVLEKSGEKIAE